MQRWSKHTNLYGWSKGRSAWNNLVFTLQDARCHFSLFFLHNCIIFSILPPSETAFIENWLQLLPYNYHVIVM